MIVSGSGGRIVVNDLTALEFCVLYTKSCMEKAVITRAPLGDQVYQGILKRIQHGSLPPGSKIQDSQLAAELGVSRTPVREALARLAWDGVLAAQPGRGFKVKPLEARELREVGGLLGVLEPLALELSPNFAPSQVDRLADLVSQLERTRGDIGRCVDLEDEWHRVILENCPNQRMLQIILSLRHVARRYLHAFLAGAGRVSLSTVFHARIVDALRREDRAAAAQLLQRQWQRGVEELTAGA